ncbi:hypothetical protein KW782_00770 [Candidatus Parcubacteria bacterium]|nr:hypothetical protein [Candidatus Parcubacteria bacterium]
MELEDFITTTLLEIQRGIRNANIKIAKEAGKKLGVDETIQYQIDRGNKGIKFDVAVTVSNEKGGEGGGKIKVAVIDVGGSKTTASKEEYVSHITFEVNPFRSVH